MARALSLGLGCDLDVATPLAGFHKDRVVHLGVEFGVPLELSLSCMNPPDDRHCGECSKCRERQDAFRDAGVKDRTVYATARAQWRGGPSGPPGAPRT